ncbi:MAG: virulence factor SrfB [Desulfarculales bacterium]|jgi:hypothetical protein|nr:virulence factor SrfB [Desulfarculales bacterium]
MEMPKYNYPVSLIPGGCPQFLDFAFDLETTDAGSIRFSRIFKEEKQDKTGDGRRNFMLRCLEEDERGKFADQLSHEPVKNFDYETDSRKCLNIYLDQWFPLPLLRLKEMKRPDGSPMYELGPSNWCRCRLTRPGEKETGLRMVLVFDTTVEEAPPGETHYHALAPGDVAANAVFSLAWHVRDNTWFLNSAWVDRWLYAIYEKFRKKAKKYDDGLEHTMLYLANYLTLLELLHNLLPSFKVKVINPQRDIPVDVDLIIDIGNSRTTGILVETMPQRLTDLNNSYLMQIRDLSRPENIYTEPFASRIEFSEAQFGDEAYSKLSGRRTMAFNWPSAVRMGPEAARLATQARNAEGTTGMSSPKRYLWDERMWKPTWRYNTGGDFEPMVTKGSFAQQVNHMGTPLSAFDDPLLARNPLYRAQEREIAFESQFTRSSIMMFLMAEVIIQTLVTINSPAQRGRREMSDLPRRLRRIVFIVPSSMPIAEQRIYKRWVNLAVRAVWSACGWEEWYLPAGAHAGGGSDYRQSPECHCNWDEATCTHLVYLYNEIAYKFRGDAHYFFNLTGQDRKEYSPYPSLRVASIDVGGGTTDLSIVTYTLDNDERSSTRLRPHLEMRDGFNVAGDDILRSVIVHHLLPPIGKAADSFGVSNPRHFLSSCFGRDVLDSSQEQRSLRSQFARQIAAPAGLALLKVYEDSDPMINTGGQFVLGDFFSDGQGKTLSGKKAGLMPFEPAPAPNQAVIDYVEEMARKSSPANENSSFNLMEVVVPVDPAKIERTVKEVIGRILADLSEVIYLYNCDVLLLTGRPSRLPGVISSLLAKLPLTADRIIPMCQYRVGRWYPFVDALGNISDPKTTVSMGAILCALAEGHLEGFSFAAQELRLVSTARYIGEMDTYGQITKAKVWFEIDVDRNAEQRMEKEVLLSGPLSIGFRQFPAERWPTSRFYLMDFANEDDRRQASGSGSLPYQVSIGFQLKEMDIANPNQEYDEGNLFVTDVTDSKGNQPRGGKNSISLRLQTMPLDEGYWLDTGVLFN